MTELRRVGVSVGTSSLGRDDSRCHDLSVRSVSISILWNMALLSHLKKRLDLLLTIFLVTFYFNSHVSVTCTVKSFKLHMHT